MQTEPVILSLETATLDGSVSLLKGTNRLATRLGDPNISHSNTILAQINECLNEAGIVIDDVNLFACASGPGSFTGLRIGIATVKALAATLHRPCVGVSTLAAIARGAGLSEATVAVLPAGRGEVFAQRFQVLPRNQIISVDKAAHLSPQNLIDRYAEVPDLVWAGPGAHVHSALLRDQARERGIDFMERLEGRGWRLAPPDNNLAEHIAALALTDFQHGEVQSAESLHATYVRPSDVEMNQSWR